VDSATDKERKKENREINNARKKARMKEQETRSQNKIT
jgi:hypothetical protein